MTTLTITTPTVTTEEMQAIWDAQPQSTLSLYNGRRLIGTQPLFCPRLPTAVGEHVPCKPVLFQIEAQKDRADCWSAHLFGQRHEGGRFDAIHLRRGDSILVTLIIRGR